MQTKNPRRSNHIQPEKQIHVAHEVVDFLAVVRSEDGYLGSFLVH
jgi:hypothetical protein